MEERDNCIEEITTLEEVDVISTGGTGTSDYNDLENKPKINDITLEGNKTLDELNIQVKGDYALKSDIPNTNDFATKEEIQGLASQSYVDGKVQYLIDNDIDNITELVKELQDVTTKGIYVGYINSVTPNRNNMEEIIKKAINANASMIILRPTINLPQNFVAISSGPNLQNYKDGGKGYMFFTDINEHSDSNEMPSVMSYTTKVTFTVVKNDDIEVTIDNVETDFVSGINSTSQHAYVLHTKNETEYMPTKDYHPVVKKYVDDSIKEAITGALESEY